MVLLNEEVPPPPTTTHGQDLNIAQEFKYGRDLVTTRGNFTLIKNLLFALCLLSGKDGITPTTSAVAVLSSLKSIFRKKKNKPIEELVKNTSCKLGDCINIHVFS